MKDVQIPALLNDPNIPDITQCERTERTFFRSRLQNRKTKCSGWKESGKISIPRHLADFSGLVASYELYHPKAQRSKAGCISAGSLSKHAMVRSRLLVSCLSPAVCHQAPVISPPFIFHSHSTLRLSISSIYSSNTVILGSETEHEKTGTDTTRYKDVFVI